MVGELSTTRILDDSSTADGGGMTSETAMELNTGKMENNNMMEVGRKERGKVKELCMILTEKYSSSVSSRMTG